MPETDPAPKRPRGRPTKAPADRAERVSVRVDPETLAEAKEHQRPGEPLWHVFRRAMGLQPIIPTPRGA